MKYYTKDFLDKEIALLAPLYRAWYDNPSDELRKIILQKRANFGLEYTMTDKQSAHEL